MEFRFIALLIALLFGAITIWFLDRKEQEDHKEGHVYGKLNLRSTHERMTTFNEEVNMNDTCIWCGGPATCRDPYCPGDMTEVLDNQEHEPVFCTKHGYEVPCPTCKTEQEAHAATCDGCDDCMPF